MSKGFRFGFGFVQTGGAATQAPVITGSPTISGTEQVGRTLTATPATVTGSPEPTRTWQWERGGVPISGATSSTYLLVVADQGATITVVQTETNSEGVDTSESAATGIIAADSSAPSGATALETNVSGIVAEYNFSDNYSAASGIQAKSLTVTPDDGSNNADWNLGVVATVSGQAPTLDGVGSDRGYLWSNTANDPTAAGEGYFQGLVSGANLPTFIKDLHKLSTKTQFTFAIDFEFTGASNNASSSFLSTVNANNETGFTLFNAASNSSTSRIDFDTRNDSALVGFNVDDSPFTNTFGLNRQQILSLYFFIPLAQTNSPRFTNIIFSADEGAPVAASPSNVLPTNPVSTNDPDGFFYLGHDLANSRTIADGGKLYKFIIKQGVLTSEDVIYMFNYMNGGSLTADTTNIDLGNFIYQRANDFDYTGGIDQSRSFSIKSDGTRIIATDIQNAKLVSYTLSTGWDLTTISKDAGEVTMATLGDGVTLPTNIFVKPDGTKFYYMGQNNTTIYQKSMSTPWDITTQSDDAKSLAVGTTVEHFHFSSDGLNLYLPNPTAENTPIRQFTLSTAWDVSTAVDTGNAYNFGANGNGLGNGAFWMNDGENYMVIVDLKSDIVLRYNFGTPQDITTLSYAGTFMNPSYDYGETHVECIAVNPTFDKMILSNRLSSTFSQYLKGPATVPVITGVPTISGIEESYQSLAATAAPASGLPDPDITWQWKRSGTPISGATSSTYLLTAVDEGETITVVQTETNTAGSDTAESTATGVIAVGVAPPSTEIASLAVNGSVISSTIYRDSYGDNLTTDLIAVYDGSVNFLRAWQTTDGQTITQVGNDFPLTQNGSSSGLFQWKDSHVFVLNNAGGSTVDTIQAYSWNGTDFDDTGFVDNIGLISLGAYPQGCRLSDTHVVIANNTEFYVCSVASNGTLTIIGTPTSASGNYHSICYVAENCFADYDTAADLLTYYSVNTSTGVITQVGNSLSIVNAGSYSFSWTGFDNEVIGWDASGNVVVYFHDGTDWTAGASVSSGVTSTPRNVARFNGTQFLADGGGTVRVVEATRA